MIIRHREVTGLLVNATIVVLMALCGVNVPVSFYPAWLAWISRCLPITNGLGGDTALGVAVFVTKFNAAGNAVVYSTYLSGVS